MSKWMIWGVKNPLFFLETSMYYLNLQVPFLASDSKTSNSRHPVVTEAEIAPKVGILEVDLNPHPLGSRFFHTFLTRYTGIDANKRDRYIRKYKYLRKTIVEEKFLFFLYWCFFFASSHQILKLLDMFFFVSRNLCAFWSKMCLSEALRPRI